jgi:O-antigen ligase
VRARSTTLSAHAARVSRDDGPSLTANLARLAGDSWPALAIAAAIAAVCFGATGGVQSLDGSSPSGAGLGPNTVVEMALTLGGGLLVALAFAREPRGRVRVFGFATAVALFALAAFSVLSVDWSVAPANSWLEASRTFSYAASFAGAIALVRLAAGRWRSVIAGVLLATVAVSAYAVASKIVPATLDASDTMARLAVPFGYWNAVGLIGALGLAPALWLGSRREGHGAVNALAAPAIAVLLVALVLSYSRGAVLAAVVGVAIWFALVPLRLRALAMLAIGGVAGGGVVAWAFAQPALSDNGVSLAARSSSGHRLGLLLLAALAVAFAAALVVRFAGDRNPLAPARRRTLGIAVAVALALVPVAAVGAAAHSSRGLFGTISHGWNELTTANAQQPSNSASRLTSTGSMQALYWSYALDIFDANPVAGAGVGSYGVASQRFMTGPDKALNAHGYVFQTLADLGLIGLALSLAVAIGWAIAAARAVGPFRARAPGAGSAERLGLLTLIVVVVTFAVHSAVDWVYFVPGEAVIALLCAGWVAGRGPWQEPLEPGERSLARLTRSPVAAAGAATAIALALVVAWSQWQPLRSEQAATAGANELGNANAALIRDDRALVRRDLAAARADELTAIARDPLDITPRADLAGAYNTAGEVGLAQRSLERAVQLQPSNAVSWFDLWQFDSGIPRYAKFADQALAVTYHLDPYDPGLDESLGASG